MKYFPIKRAKARAASQGSILNICVKYVEMNHLPPCYKCAIFRETTTVPYRRINVLKPSKFLVPVIVVLGIVTSALLIYAPDSHSQSLDIPPAYEKKYIPAGLKFSRFLPADSERTPPDMVAQLAKAPKGELALAHAAIKIGEDPVMIGRMFITGEYELYRADGAPVSSAGFDAQTDVVAYHNRTGEEGEILVCAEPNGKRTCLSSWCGNNTEFRNDSDYAARKIVQKATAKTARSGCADYTKTQHHGMPTTSLYHPYVTYNTQRVDPIICKNIPATTTQEKN